MMMVGGGVTPWGTEVVVEALLECWADGSLERPSNTVSERGTCIV